jgi:hypothetical protein
MPLGTVTFEDNGSPIGTRGLVNGVARLTTISLSVGSHSITAMYTATMNFAASTSAAISQVVGKDRSLLAIATSASPSKLGQTVTFTVTGFAAAPGAGSPTGPVSFFDGNRLLGVMSFDPNRHAALSTFTLSVGAHAISATYGGDMDFTGNHSPTIQQVVNPQVSAPALAAWPPEAQMTPHISLAPPSLTATLSVVNTTLASAAPFSSTEDRVVAPFDNDVYATLARAHKRATILDDRWLPDLYWS